MSLFFRLSEWVLALSDRFDKPYETRLEKFGYFLVGYAPNVRKNITMSVLDVPVTEWESIYRDGCNIGDSHLCARVENPHTGESVDMRVKNRFLGFFIVRFLRGRIGALIA